MIAVLVKPNGIKKLFGNAQKWKVNDGRKMVNAAWDYLGYER